jgi:Protein of unknown function (DUF3106)
MHTPRSSTPSRAIKLGAAIVGILILLGLSDTSRSQNSANQAVPQPVSAAKPALKVTAKTWDKLSGPQQQALAPLQKQWDTMEGARQAKWLALSDRYEKSTPEQKQRMQERMQAWATITPEQRAKARENFQAVRKLDPNTRAEKWSSYEQLPAEKRIEMHNKVEALRQTSSPASTRPATAPATVAPGAAATAKQRVDASPNAVDQRTLLPATTPAAKPQ